MDGGKLEHDEACQLKEKAQVARGKACSVVSPKFVNQILKSHLLDNILLEV